MLWFRAARVEDGHVIRGHWGHKRAGSQLGGQRLEHFLARGVKGRARLCARITRVRKRPLEMYGH